jgi:hypothetical protein
MVSQGAKAGSEADMAAKMHQEMQPGSVEPNTTGGASK